VGPIVLSSPVVGRHFKTQPRDVLCKAEYILVVFDRVERLRDDLALLQGLVPGHLDGVA
jgi:hypothetical protein